MNKILNVLWIVVLAVVFFVINNLLNKKSGKKNDVLTKYMDNLLKKTAKKMGEIDKKLGNLEKKKVNKDVFKDYSNDNLINFIKHRLKKSNRQ